MPHGASEWFMEQLFDKGLSADDIERQRQELANKARERDAKGEQSVRNVIMGLTSFKTDQIEVMGIKEQPRRTQQDKANKIDLQVKLVIVGLDNAQTVNIQVKSSEFQIEEFVKNRMKPGEGIDDAWLRIRQMDLVVLNGQDEAEKIRRDFLYQLGNVMITRSKGRKIFNFLLKRGC